ncbi:hypothetical protein LIER_03083 [Lithospermum erythrorhizon]|uniref:Uncharacterized protein n=1 Tax=Lithospermum erythrorhizon TaxID=34254 RepID=A0AAV3NTE1_LITER
MNNNYDDEERLKKIFQRVSAENFATWTEVLGHESLNENAKCNNNTPVASTLSIIPPMRSRNAAERKTPADVLPPFLTTLNENGSPKFNLVKLREKGRLRIGTELNERKEVLASRTQRSMRMRFITSANEEGDDDLRECDQERKEEIEEVENGQD